MSSEVDPKSLLLFKILACDYDGTLATQDTIALKTEQALIAAKKAGLLLALVTGRELADLLQVCSQFRLFDLIVAENGAVLYWPDTDKIEDLGSPPPPSFTQALIDKNLPFSVGRVILSTGRIYESEVLSSIHELGLDLQVIFNKDAAMILPWGVDKAIGLEAGLKQIGITLNQVISIGDAENDAVFLRASGLNVAVANAIASIKTDANFVTHQPNGAGVAEFIYERLLGQNGLNQ